MASPGHSDLGEVAPEIKASERRTAVAIADLEWREMEGDDCEFRYGDGTNEAQDNDFPTGAVLEPRAALRLARPAHLRGLRQGNLDGEDHAAERTVEDVFLRKFMWGTFPGCLADQLVLKRRGNQLEICALVLRNLPPHKYYFLVGYSETLLSYFYKCPVRLHLQTVPSKVVYKYL
uniref:Upregulator of cell proliferation n=1 Tax=Papio anubis TaxID=9555 RepID=A0A8I5NG36_PAPAN